jgi:TRAP-type C4-dicarboxylate transport system permease small subunit
MRRFLDWLYRASGLVAAILLLVLGLAVLAQIFGRLIGVVVPGVIQGAGFLMVATVFLALAYTHAEAEHIRVSLVIENVSQRWRWWIELWCLAFSACIAAYYTVYSGQLAWESWLFNYSSDGLVAIPTSIPQAVMALGLAIFCVRLVDELFQLARAKTPLYFESSGTGAHRTKPDEIESGKHNTRL